MWSTTWLVVATVIYGDFEWDEAKALSNTAKHGVSFEEAATAVVDPNGLFLEDDSRGETRFAVIGMSERARVLFVVHVERGRRDRIISARLATKPEELLYAQEHE
jgi:uncharacterized protein